MDSRMIEAAQTGNINALYELIQGDPYLLERFDQVPFFDTPLHLAAAGHTEHLPFVMEMINLKPSFAKKLNPAGFSPMHLALQCGNKKSTVLQLLKFDKGLVRVKGREGLTSLHHAVQFENLDILIEFLEVCPEAIEDVTVQGETAFHIALKHDMFTAFEVLVGWLRRSCHKDAQRWEKELLLGGDIEGNTVLHIAVIKNLPWVVKLLLENFSHDYMTARNLEDLTALDIASLEQERDESQTANNRQILDMLKKSGGLIRSLRGKKPNSSIKIDSLRSKMSCYHIFKTAIARGRSGISEEMRNAFLVVTVLIITTTYTASLNPPSIIKDVTDKIKDTNTVSSSTAPAPVLAPGGDPGDIEVYIPDVYSLFWLYNTLTFWASVGITACLLPSRRSFCLLLLITLSLFGACFMLLTVAVSCDLGFYQLLSTIENDVYASPWYHSISIVNYVFSLLLALLVAYRIACYVCVELAKTRRVPLIGMSLISFLLIAATIICPAMWISEYIWKDFSSLYRLYFSVNTPYFEQGQ